MKQGPSSRGMARKILVVALMSFLVIRIHKVEGHDSLTRRNLNTAVMITSKWHIQDCTVRNCHIGNFYETSSRNTAITNKNHQIHLGVLLPSRPVDEMSERSTQILATTLPVIELAIQSVKEKRILEGYDLVIHHRDTQCSSTIGPIKAFDLYNSDQADVFLGPICDYVLAPVARYAGVWQRPLLTTGGLASAFNNKVNVPLKRYWVTGFIFFHFYGKAKHLHTSNETDVD